MTLFVLWSMSSLSREREDVVGSKFMCTPGPNAQTQAEEAPGMCISRNSPQASKEGLNIHWPRDPKKTAEKNLPFFSKIRTKEG